MMGKKARQMPPVIMDIGDFVPENHLLKKLKNILISASYMKKLLLIIQKQAESQ